MKNVSYSSVILLMVFLVPSAMAATGLTIDVTGPGGLGVKQVQPGLFTGEIWATVTGVNPALPEGLQVVTGGLQLTGGGSFLPFTATNYEVPWNNASDIPVDLSTDGKTLGHGGRNPTSALGILSFMGPSMIDVLGPYRLGTFQANMQEGDSIQFLLSGQSAPMYLFKVDNIMKTGVSGYNLLHLGDPLVAVPEPSTFVLLGIGVMGLFAWSRRRSRKAV
jgi:hypothetical protein